MAELLRKIAPKAQGVQIMSAQSARQIVDILAQAPAPDGRVPALLTQEAPVIAAKTGTSYGFRDAWAAATGNGYAVVVWIGRADSGPRPGVTGREGALPALFDVYDAIGRVLPKRSTGPSLREEIAGTHTPPSALARFERQNAPPQIFFPPDGAEVWKDGEHSSFVLSAQGRGKLAWYVDGKPLPHNVAGDTVWRPADVGFYEIQVVDDAGRTTKARVRVMSPNG